MAAHSPGHAHLPQQTSRPPSAHPCLGTQVLKVLMVTTPQSTQSQKSSYIQLLPVGRGEGAT